MMMKEGEVNAGNSDDYFRVPDDIPADDAFSLMFLISLSITFGLLLLVLILISVYLTFCGGSDAADSDEEDEGSGSVSFKFFRKGNSLLLDSSFMTPGKFDDEQALLEQEAEELPRMSRFEVELYERTKEFQKMSPPMVKPFGTFLNSQDKQMIKERGIQSYFFLPSINDNVDRNGSFLPSFFVEDKLNVTFTKFNVSSSAIMNYPLPMNRKDAVYFEVKVYKFKPCSNSIFSIGLMTCPYPYFRIPGTAIYSIAYESTGKLRINNAFRADTLLPKLEEGDVVGFGYRYSSGTIFITHNGKKMMDVTHRVGIDLFVGIGAMNAAYTRTYTKDGLFEDPDNVSFRQKWTDVTSSNVGGGSSSSGSQGASHISDVINPQLLEVHDPKDSPVSSDPIELHVNLGQLGFVFIEANVKKYAFGSVYGDIGIPPAYNGDDIKQDMLLQKGEELPPEYPDDEVDFFGGVREHTTESRAAAGSAVGSEARIAFGNEAEASASTDQGASTHTPGTVSETAPEAAPETSPVTSPVTTRKTTPAKKKNKKRKRKNKGSRR